MTRALVIDDDASTAELLRVILEEAGLDVTVAAEERQIPAASFDVILTDLMNVIAYSREDARDWVLRVADRFPRVPIIVVTAHAEAALDQGYLGARAVILKPFDVDVIPRAVREATTS